MHAGPWVKLAVTAHKAPWIWNVETTLTQEPFEAPPRGSSMYLTYLLCAPV